MKNMRKIIIVVFIITVVIVSFNSKYSSLIKDFKSEVHSEEAQINQYINLSSSFIDLMNVYGTNFIRQNSNENLRFFRLLKYNPTLNNYNLDAIAGTKYEKLMGNITGEGLFTQNSLTKNSIYLALQYNKYFTTFYDKFPGIAWIYYTSEDNFINIYPWVSSKDFGFTKKLKNEPFYKQVIPENDPLRKHSWTPVYNDAAGKGLMVTLSSPIYEKHTFKGVISLDFTNVELSKIMNSQYQSFLIDDTNSIIATSLKVKFAKKMIKLNELLNFSQNEIDTIKEVKKHTIQRFGKYYIYSTNFIDVPWMMFFIVPVWKIVFQSVLFSLPILAVCILLFFSINEIEKNKRTETMLKSSLDELQSYHELLENSAKYDFLTNSCNRRGLKEIFNKNIKLNIDSKIPISFIFGDIDYFKLFNDSYGHAAGDKILIEISNLMKINIGNDDVVCRWGGEEFLIMLLNKSYDEAMIIAEKIRKEIEVMVVPWENSMKLRATMTFGVIEYDYNISMEDSISKADHALYIGKEKGRNQVIGYNNL